MRYVIHPEADVEFADAVRYYAEIAPDADLDGKPDKNLCKQIFDWRWKTFKP